MKNNKNQLVTVDREALVNATFASSDTLRSAIEARTGGSKIEVATDTDGNEYAKATFALKAPAGERKEITITNMALATTIEEINNALALGDVSQFYTAKKLESIVDTDAVEQGFDNAVALAVSVFGLAKSTVENYRRLSRFFVGDDFQTVGAIPKDCPISTLNQLLSKVEVDENGHHDISNVEALFKSGIITPYMKQKEVKARLASMASMESDKALKDMTAEELASLKENIIKAKATESKPKTKAEASTTETSATETSAHVTVSDNPQVLAGEMLNKIKEVKALAEKMGLDWSDSLNVMVDLVTEYLEKNGISEEPAKATVK